ncbi:hypothetical protein JKP88DRAFT_289505 [Tribonema minus]|uniref:Uncharacterized protein n=1 Tax=Tribonema minus TaxID=303371 RepID=A0A835Z4S7_9STRA|nr:hypothetical protein JKP88DRAFT_289505 [Tribonema minus]
MRELRRRYRVESCADPDYTDRKRRCRARPARKSKPNAKRPKAKVAEVRKAVKRPASKAPVTAKVARAPAAASAPAAQQLPKAAKQEPKAARAPTTARASAAPKQPPAPNGQTVERRGDRLLVLCDIDGAYEALNAPTSLQFAGAYPFINGNFKVSGRKIRMTIDGHAAGSNAATMTWAEILCEDVNPIIKASPCQVGSTQKVFFKKAKDLGDLIKQISRGGISRAEVTSLFQHLHRILGSSFYNDNRDVRILHFKA